MVFFLETGYYLAICTHILHNLSISLKSPQKINFVIASFTFNSALYGVTCEKPSLNITATNLYPTAGDSWATFQIFMSTREEFF